MTVRGKWRGWSMHIIDGEWVYDDATRLVSECPDRSCGHCRMANRADGHDACLGHITGVRNACCGHGVEDDAYVQFADGRYLSGCLALLSIREKNGKKK